MAVEATPRIPNTVLVVGSGAREHALGWKLKQSPLVNEVLFAPGNAGTTSVGKNLDRGPKDIDDLVSIAADRKAMVIIGPEDPLMEGLSDAIQEAGQLAFGPRKEAAMIEGSKALSDALMDKYGIPHAHSQVFSNQAEAAEFIKTHPWGDGIVLKADGLAAGKGVLLPDSPDEALIGLQVIMGDKVFGQAGDTVLIQERLSGYEVSAIGISDSTTIIPMILTQDHKRLLDGDEGPNTGGMGAYGPVPMVDAAMQQQILTQILQPTIDGLKAEGNPFQGALYAGLMITKDGPKVLEYNSRFGDPETEVLMMLLDEDFAQAALEVAQGKLQRDSLRFRPGYALTTIMASEGYPGSYRKGEVITGLDTISNPNIVVFQAGTKLGKDGQTETSGGRVLAVTGIGNTLQEAADLVYQSIGPNGVDFPGAQYRTDIGSRALPGNRS